MAAAYLNLRKPRMACIYTERVLYNIHKLDRRRLYTEKHSFHIRDNWFDEEAWTKPEPHDATKAVDSEVLAVASQNNYLHAQFDDALSKLYEAHSLGGLDSIGEQQLEMYEARRRASRDKRDRRQKQQELKSQTLHRENKGMCNSRVSFPRWEKLVYCIRNTRLISIISRNDPDSPQTNVQRRQHIPKW